MSKCHQNLALHVQPHCPNLGWGLAWNFVLPSIDPAIFNTTVRAEDASHMTGPWLLRSWKDGIPLGAMMGPSFKM